MSNDERPAATNMHARTLADLDQDYSDKGRWTGHDRPTVTGTRPTWQAPAISGSGPWATTDIVPPEEPLGYCVDEVPDLTTVSGIARELLAPVPDTPTDEEPFEP
jgi:hypothetical protein